MNVESVSGYNTSAIDRHAQDMFSIGQLRAFPNQGLFAALVGLIGDLGFSAAIDRGGGRAMMAGNRRVDIDLDAHELDLEPVVFVARVVIVVVETRVVLIARCQGPTIGVSDLTHPIADVCVVIDLHNACGRDVDVKSVRSDDSCAIHCDAQGVFSDRQQRAAPDEGLLTALVCLIG